jgi:hypothetical protein
VADNNSERLPVQAAQSRPDIPKGSYQITKKKKKKSYRFSQVAVRESVEAARSVKKRVLTKTVLPSPAQDIAGINLTQISALSAS